MIASRMPTVKIERAGLPGFDISNTVVQPRNWSSQRVSPSRYGTRKSAPQRP
jgi:hypothetical protein